MAKLTSADAIRQAIAATGGTLTRQQLASWYCENRGALPGRWYPTMTDMLTRGTLVETATGAVLPGSAKARGEARKPWYYWDDVDYDMKTYAYAWAHPVEAAAFKAKFDSLEALIRATRERREDATPVVREREMHHHQFRKHQVEPYCQSLREGDFTTETPPEFVWEMPEELDWPM